MAKVTKKVKETNGNGAGKLAEEAMAEALNLQGDTDEKLATARMKVAKAEAEGAPDSVKAVWEQRVQFLENLKKEEERPMGKKEKKATEKKVAEAKEAKEKKETKPAKAAAKAAPKATLKAAAKPAKAVKAVKADKPKVDKPKKEPKPKKEGVECFCGCKQTTNPGREYRMGHDARFKSMVKKYLRKEVKLTELPERVQHLIKTNNPAVVKVKTEIGA